MHTKVSVWNIFSWLFGVAVVAAGIVNTFWGNDPFFGIFLILLSMVYFPPLDTILKQRTRRSIRAIIKVGLGIFIGVAALGVGELFNKIDLMMMDLYPHGQ